MGDKAGRRWATAAMEDESREWLVRCPACGHERSIWELGGVRYKARGTKRQFRRCPACRQVSWHLVYRQRDGLQLPPLRPARPLWWHIGAFAAVLLLFLGLLGGGLFLILSRVSAGPRDATNGYFAAVIARDWAGAHGRLGAAQRDRVSPEDVAATWGLREREGARGPADGFRITGYSSRNGRTSVSGTLRYRDGATESRTVWLDKEDRAWKIVSDP